MQDRQFEIRRCDSRQAGRLTEIAHAAKRHWGYPDRYIAAWRGELTLTPAFVVSHEVHAAVIGATLAGFYALARDGKRVELEHLWVDPSRIGQGVGRALFRHALERARSLGARTIEVTSDPNAEGFYARMGAQRVGNVEAPVLGEARRLPRLSLEIRSA